MSLQKEIDARRQEIRTDKQTISLGQWISLYKENEIDIHPEFQRFFRWTSFQKSRLIESIILGIPVPPIFVAQREDGVWDVVDGLQRLSTIFEFVGVLKDDRGEQKPLLKLEGTRYLPSLEGKFWESAVPGIETFTQAQRLLFKRSSLDVSVILRESQSETKFELFQRLNTGGTPLTDQETRNAILVMIDQPSFKWIRDLADAPEFENTTLLTDRLCEEQYDMELVLRFLLLRNLNKSELSAIRDIGTFLTEKMVERAEGGWKNRSSDERAFHQAFSTIHQNVGESAFRRFDPAEQKFKGGFLVSAFEAVALGIGSDKAIASPLPPSELNEKVKEIWSTSDFTDHIGRGISPARRVPYTIPFGSVHFTAP